MISDIEIHDLFLEESNRTYTRIDNSFLFVQNEYNGYINYNYIEEL